MLILLSPSKKLDDTTPASGPATQPELLKEAEKLITLLRKMNTSQVAKLMDLSPALAELNVTRYKHFHTPFTPKNAKPALDAFKGDVYDGLSAENFTAKDREYAQAHLRILSGLYGILRPLDLMQPYRLEMGSKLVTPRGKNLYQFWGDTLTRHITETLKAQKSSLLINLASNEYAKAVQFKQLQAEVITPQFKEYKKGRYTTLMLYAKRARGQMARYILTHRLTRAAQLKDFAEDGYHYNATLSTKDAPVFTRGD